MKRPLALLVAAALVLGQARARARLSEVRRAGRRPAGHGEVGAVAGALFRCRTSGVTERHLRRSPGRCRPRVRHLAGRADRVDHLSVRAASPSASPGSDDGSSALGFQNRPDLDRVLASTSFLVDRVHRRAGRVRHLLQLRVSVVGRAGRRNRPVRSREHRAPRDRPLQRARPLGARRNRAGEHRRPPRARRPKR